MKTKTVDETYCRKIGCRLELPECGLRPEECERRLEENKTLK